MIDDQLTTLEAAPFYNSNFSKPYKSASPFGEAQLDKSYQAPQKWHEAHALDEMFHQAQLAPAFQKSLRAPQKSLRALEK